MADTDTPGNGSPGAAEGSVKGAPGDVPEEARGQRVTWLDASAVRLYRDAAGHVRATVRFSRENDEDDRSRSILRPALFRAFPISLPGSYVELREEGGEAVGMLKGLSSLDRESRAIAEELLRERYVVPVIRRITSLRHEFGAWAWEVETDRGERSFTMKSPRDDLKQFDGGRARVTDVHGSTYEIKDIAELDSRSRSLFSHIA